MKPVGLKPLLIAMIFLSGCSGAASDAEEATAHYLANEGVMVARGQTKIVFDPLFDSSYGQYQLLPTSMKEALLEGAPPYDGIDAVFISHFHGDHFSPAEMLQFMKRQTSFTLVAPEQAVEGLREIAAPEDSNLFERITAVTLEYGDEPIRFELDGIVVEAVRIPHSGWPAGRTNVQNIAYRVTLDNQVTVLHMGDADTKDLHFSRDSEYWASRQTDMAFPPYWFFASKEGRNIIAQRLAPQQAIGVHVPVAMPDDPASRLPEYRGVDLFTEPGETRIITPKKEE